MNVRRRRNRAEPEIGQRYRKAGSGVWEVVGMNRDQAGLLHVRLRRLDDPLTEKTLAATALSDARDFVQVPAD